jgi:polysaccharide export outer membrane protein
VACVSLLFASCTSSKKVAYLQTLTDELPPAAAGYEARIMPKDLLTITVVCSDPIAAQPFNLVVPNSESSVARGTTYSQPVLQNYLVNNNGEIDFPVVGVLKIGGMSTQEVTNMIVDKLSPYLKERPIVTIRLINYRVSVIGEVTRPGTFTINNEQVSLFEALAMAGDMTIYGRRDNVRIIRNENGVERIITLNANDKNIIFSPDFYLKQNDVVYVEPNRAKRQSADIGTSTNLIISITSILISIAGLMVNILR